MATIGEVAKQFNLPISTLRYYDQEGLFPDMARAHGVRQFADNEKEALRVIDCLKRSGLEIKEIKHFMDLCHLGSDTYSDRLALLQQQQARVTAEIAQMERARDMLTFKCWYYEQALHDGNEERLKPIPLADMPPAIRKAYLNAHSR